MSRALPRRSARQAVRAGPISSSGHRTGHWGTGAVASCFGSTVGRGPAAGRKWGRTEASWDQTGVNGSNPARFSPRSLHLPQKPLQTQ